MPDTTKIEKFIASTNIAADLKKEQLGAIGQDVVRDFDIDWESCSDWRKQNDEGMKLAKQVAEKKDFPWPGAANIKYPLMTTAAMQFAARAYPEMIQGKDIVKGKVIGKDPTGEKERRAGRISTHMSYQITDEMEEWEEEQDRLFHAIPIVECLLKKSCYDSVKQRNVSYVLWPDEFAVNSKAKSLETARRVTHILKKYKNEIKEQENEGTWLEYDYGDADNEQGDSDSPHDFLEQHRWLDLDEDGYSEPYIVTVHRKTKYVVRIVARYEEKGVVYEGDKLIRIKPNQYFTKYGFIPNPDGSFMDIGFGTLLTPINEALNTSINELLDAGAMHNAGGGFIATGIKIKGGKLNFQLGEWKTIPTLAADLRNGIVPLPIREPSAVLFQLLGLLIEAGKDISSVKDVLMGQKPGENVSAETVLALIEQGMKVFSAIYKRIYRSLTSEFKKLFWLNSKFVDPRAYENILDEEKQVDALQDYNMEDVDVRPVADPNLTLDIQRLTKARALMETLGKHPSQNIPEILRRYYDALKIPDIDKLFVTEPPPDPQVEQLYLQMGIMRDRWSVEKQKLLAEVGKLYTEQLLNIAKAEAAEAGPQIEQYKTQVQALGMWLKSKNDAMSQEGETGGSNQGGTGGMEAESGNMPSAGPA